MARKKCFKCGVEKPLTDFYKHSEMKDGHLNKCKECAKLDVRLHRAENIDRIREYDRKRGKLPHRIKLATEQTRKWRAEDKRRAKCHSRVSWAIRSGKITPQDCEVCGNQRTEAHHDNYDKPLDIRWLCNVCHKEWHKNNVAF